jgi:hypothetical protein
MEVVMRKNIAVIPKKTKVQIMGCSYELIDSVRVKGKQKYLNQVLKDQTDFHNGVGIVSESPKKLGYAESNRCKLSKAIKLTGFHAENLSLETGHAKTYFTGFTAESRFNSRGDITEDRLNSLLTTLAFAERKLLGVGAKTADNVKSISNNLLETNIKETLSDLDAALKSNQSDTNKSNLNKFLIVFVLVVIILAVYFFTR